MNYPEDHVEKRTTLYEAIAESNPINVQDNYTYQGSTPTTQTSTYVRESVSTYNTTPVSVSQRRATRPLGIPTHPTEIHSTSQYPPGSIQTTEEQILTRHVPMGNYEPDAVYKDETNITPLTRSVPPTASKTEKVERVVRASPGTTSTIVSSQPITTTPVVQSQNRVVYEQPLYAGNVIRIINPGEKVVEQQHTTTPVVYSSNYGQPVSTTTSVIRPQTVVYKEKAVASPTTRVIRQEEIIHETLPSPIEVKQSKVVLPVVKEFETIDNQFASQNISEIHPIGGSPYLKDSPRQAASPQNSLPQMNQVNQWESPIADLSQLRHENHQSFENWEANRNRFVNDRLNVMNDLISGMERTLDWLDVGVSKVILFFKEREAQELEYTKTIKHGLTQVGTHFDRSDHPEIMGNFSSVLKENDAFHAQDRKNSEILGMYIRKDILDWILVPNEKNYKHQADALLGSLHSSKKKLNHTSSKRQKAYNKYFKTYDSITKHGKASTKQDNLFRRQLKYSLAAREELRMLRLYNDQGLNAINEFSKMAPQRLQEVQKAYSLYLEKYSELYRNSSDTPSPVLHLINQTSGPDAVHSLFTVRTMTTPHNYQFLADNMKIYNREIVFEDLNPFLVNFPESIDPARSAFVIREWNAVKVSRILKNKACYVIATKNNNIIIIEKRHEEQETGKVKAPMHLGLTNVEEITSLEDGSMVKVVERVPGTLFTHKTKAKLKFETSNDAQEFMEYVNSQTTQTGGIV